MAGKRQPSFAEFLADHPAFTTRELATARGEPSDTDGAYEQLKHHLQTGRVKRVVRGIYAAVPPGLDAERFEPDRYLVAAAAEPDGIFAYHAALELLGVAQTVWSECVLHSPRPRAPIELDSASIVYLPMPQPLRRHGAEDMGLRLVGHESRRLRVTGPERTIVEGFRQPHRVGGVQELVESASGFPVLDFGLLEEVLEAYAQRSLWAAVGWFVVRNRGNWLPPKHFLDRCHAERPRGRQYLVRDRRGGKTLAEWNLILPPEIDTEPDADGRDA